MRNEAQLVNQLQFIRDAERLKDTLRSGWTSGGRRESVADHTWRLALMVMVFVDELEGVDQLRLLKMCILHDLGEAISGDVPAPEQDTAAPKSDSERNDFLRLISVLRTETQQEFLELWDEYENATSPEAAVAKAFDKLETILQHNQGDNPAGFDYAFNLAYGSKYTSATAVTTAIRALLDHETARQANSPIEDKGEAN